MTWIPRVIGVLEFDLGDAAAFGRPLPTAHARRKVVMIVLGLATVCAVSLLWADCA